MKASFTDLFLLGLVFFFLGHGIRWVFSKWIWPWLKDYVVTDNWDGSRCSRLDLLHRFQWAVTAGTGGILGFLLSSAIETAFVGKKQPPPEWPLGTQIVSLFLLTFIGARLFGPLHDLIERIAHSRMFNREGGSASHDLHVSVDQWYSATAVGVIVFVFLVIDEAVKQALNGALEGLSNEAGLPKTVYTLATTAIWPGIITYYWATALEKPLTGSAWRSFVGASGATWLVIFSAFAVAFAGAIAYSTWTKGYGFGGAIVLFLQFGLLLVFTALAASVVAMFATGIYAASGMFAANRLQRYRPLALLGAVLAIDLIMAVPPLLVIFLMYDMIKSDPTFAPYMDSPERETAIVVTQTLCTPFCWVGALLCEPGFRALLRRSG